MAVSQGWSHEVVNGFEPSDKNIEATLGLTGEWQNALES
jgi:hypothetical protein